MRKYIVAASVVVTLAASVSLADIDFTDFDDALMQSMDEAIKDLDSNVAGQDAVAALSNAAVLRDGFAWAEQYFAKKPEAPLGPGYVRDGQAALAGLLAALEAKDFDAANSGVRGVAKSCKSCHEAYKPPD